HREGPEVRAAREGMARPREAHQLRAPTAPGPGARHPDCSPRGGRRLPGGRRVMRSVPFLQRGLTVLFLAVRVPWLHVRAASPRVDDADTIPIRDSVPRQALRAVDAGRSPADMHLSRIVLVLAPRADAKPELARLLHA